MLGEALAEAWTKAGVVVDAAHTERLERALSANLYPVELMGRGLGYLTGAVDGKIDLKIAEHDLERSVFIDPKMFEGQRLVGELYLAEGEGRKATAKFNYANDLAPEDLASLRGAAAAARDANKHELARSLYAKIVRKQPWDLDARYELGAALWALGDAAAAQKQLEQVTAQRPDHLAARHVMVLIHASRNDTARLVAELEAIALRAPGDLDVKADLASALGATGKWTEATDQLELIAAARTPDLALLVRIGDGHRKAGDLPAALSWYAKAQRVAPESSLPGIASAQALFDAGKLPEANRFYTNLQKYKYDLGAVEEALGAIALIQNRPDDAAWYLRRAARDAQRSVITRRALIAAELARRDTTTALQQLEPALAAWPNDGQLHYLAGVAHAMADEKDDARAELVLAVASAPDYAPPRAALSALDAGGSVTLAFRPDLVRPWGDADAVQAALDRYAATAAAMAAARVQYQADVLAMLGALGEGPLARTRPGGLRTCPVGEVAPMWAAGQQALARYQRLGVELEADYRFVMRHDDIGATAGLLPNARTQVAAARKGFHLALADVGELRAEWVRGVAPDLRGIGCDDKLLAAAVADPAHYKVIQEDTPDNLPTQAPPRPRARATFYVDNTRCPDPIDVWIDGTEVGQVAPGRRSALVADGGERTLCLIGVGTAQCGDRGTLRQVYLHDGWSVTMHCPK
jgi:tetratricopeptide (TPR) repeat protein